MAFIVALAAGSCTSNNGDIDEYFGTWKLESITVNAEDDAAYSGNIFWKFQSSVFCMEMVDEYQNSTNRWGTWSRDGSILRLDFTHHDDVYDEGAGIYEPFPESHIQSGVTELKIKTLTESDMDLNYTDNDGNEIRYKLKKWG